MGNWRFFITDTNPLYARNFEITDGFLSLRGSVDGSTAAADITGGIVTGVEGASNQDLAVLVSLSDGRTAKFVQGHNAGRLDFVGYV